MILLQAHMSSLRYHPLLAAFFGINAATISPLTGSELQGARFTLRASAREREREKEKEKKHTTTHTQRPRRWMCSLWGMRASLLVALHCRMLTGEPRRRPRIHRAIRFTYPRFYPTPGGTRYRQTGTATTAQTTFYSLSLPWWVCVHAQAGSRNGLAHALQDSIVGSDSGTPKLPRSTLPVLRSTVPV